MSIATIIVEIAVFCKSSLSMCLTISTIYSLSLLLLYKVLAK